MQYVLYKYNITCTYNTKWRQCDLNKRVGFSVNVTMLIAWVGLHIQQARPNIAVLHFLAWALLVLFPSIWPICPFSFCCSWTRRASFDFSEEEEEESASRHSFWDCRRAAFFASSPHPCSSAWWWARQKRLEQKSHCKLMSDMLSLHLMRRGRREGGTRKTYTSAMSLHLKQYLRTWMRRYAQ